MERGKGKYGNEVISILLSFSNNFSRDNYHIFNLSLTAIKFQIVHQILIKLRTHKVCYEVPENKTDCFMKKLVF